MKRIILGVVVFVCGSVPVFAQTGACVVDPGAVPFVAGQARLSAVLISHAAADPGGVPVVADYLGEIRVQGQTAIVTNFTIPKTAFVAVPAPAPANCYSMVLPAMMGLLPSNLYVITTTARGPGGSAVSAASTNPFFLPAGAPSAPTNSRVHP